MDERIEEEEILSQINKEKIKPYEILGFLAKGEFGAVFRCKKGNDENFAMKIVPIDLLTNEGDIERLELEIKIMKEINHPNIINCYSAIKDQKFYYIVMDFCDGGDLANYISDNYSKTQSLPEEEAVFFLKQIASGFRVLHKNGIMHRDIKPENFLIKDRCKLVIADFGVQHVGHSGCTDIFGTDNYQAPEILKQIYGSLKEKKLDFYYNSKVDLFSIGLVFYEMLYGAKLNQYDFNSEITHPYKQLLDVALNKTGENLKFPNKKGSLAVRQFLIKVTEPVPENRLSWEEFFQHKMFTDSRSLGEDSNFLHLPKEVLQSLKNDKYFIVIKSTFEDSQRIYGHSHQTSKKNSIQDQDKSDLGNPHFKNESNISDMLNALKMSGVNHSFQAKDFNVPVKELSLTNHDIKVWYSNTDFKNQNLAMQEMNKKFYVDVEGQNLNTSNVKQKQIILTSQVPLKKLSMIGNQKSNDSNFNLALDNVARMECLDIGFVSRVNLQIISKVNRDSKKVYQIKNTLKNYYLSEENGSALFQKAVNSYFENPMYYPVDIHWSISKKKLVHEIKTIEFFATTYRNLFDLSSQKEILRESNKQEILAGCLLLRKAFMMNRVIQNLILFEYTNESERKNADLMSYQMDPSKIQSKLINHFIMQLKENQSVLKEVLKQAINEVNRQLQKYDLYELTKQPIENNNHQDSLSNLKKALKTLKMPELDLFTNRSTTLEGAKKLISAQFKDINEKLNESIIGIIQIFLKVFKTEQQKDQELKNLQQKFIYYISKVYMCKDSEEFFKFIDRSYGYFDWGIFMSKLDANFVKQIFLIAV